MHPECFSQEFEVEVGIDFSDIFEQTTSQEKITAPEGPANKRYNSSFFHGRYRKYSGSLSKKNYIIKVEEPNFPELPAVEYICNQLAKLLGLQLPQFHYILYNNQVPSFLSRNLMDNYAPATLDHIYKFLGENSSFDCETLSGIIQTQTGRLSDVHKFVEICLFDAIIGNHDRHGRNLAFVTRSGGRILAPFYDNPSYVGIESNLLLGSDIQPRGTIYTKESKTPSIKDYVQEFKRLGLEPAVEKFGQKVISKSAAMMELIQNNKIISPKRTAALIRLIDSRIKELENG